MKKLILMLVTFILTLNTISYGATKKKVVSNNSNTPQKVAENFVNGYSIRIRNGNSDNWVLKNSNITENFRNIYEELVEYYNSFDFSQHGRCCKTSK